VTSARISQKVEGAISIDKLSCFNAYSPYTSRAVLVLGTTIGSGGGEIPPVILSTGCDNEVRLL